MFGKWTLTDASQTARTPIYLDQSTCCVRASLMLVDVLTLTSPQGRVCINRAFSS